jgi:hypothetical protein
MTDGLRTDPADRRRAAALISHRATVDEVGARYVIEEAATADRLPQLLAAVIDHGGKLLAALRTDMGIEAVSSLFDTWANQTENIDYRLAGSAYIARIQGRHDYFDAYIVEATEAGRMAELVNTAAQTFLTVMPELHSPKGIATLAQVAAFIAGQEEPPDGTS